jgi:hypothetical protein
LNQKECNLWAVKICGKTAESEILFIKRSLNLQEPISATPNKTHQNPILEELRENKEI